MTSRLVRFCAAFVSAVIAFDAFAQVPPPAQPPNLAAPPAAAPGATPQPGIPPAGPADDPVLLNIPGADIDTIITALENFTGRVALYPSQLATAPGGYSIKIKNPIPKSEAIIAIETVLALNNIGVSPLGDRFIKVVNLGDVRREAPEMITGSAFDQPAGGKPATKLFQLEFARVQEVAPLIAGMLNPFYGGPVSLPNANAILITDSISNLQRVEILLQKIDQPVTAGMKPKYYQLKNGAKASDVVNKLRAILTGTLQTQLGSATTYSADDRTNQVIVVTDPRQHGFFDEIIDRLDQRADPNTRNDVIYLKHAKASEVVEVLSRIISGQTQAIQRQGPGSVRPLPGLQPQPFPGVPMQPGQPTPAPQPNVIAATNALNAEGLSSNEFSAFMTVVNDDRSNSVVVSGTTDDIRLVKELIEKLDMVLAQVRIEVVIAEVTLLDNSSSGISQLGLKVEGDKLVGFAGAVPGLSVLGPDGAENSFAAITRPETGGLDLAGTVFIGTTPRKSSTAILSVPTITTSHAKEANVFVGQTRPVISGTINSGLSGGTTSSVTQLEIGVDLTVTPLIGADGSVQLDIKQDVDEVSSESVTVDGNVQPIVLKRTTASFVSVKSGEIIVLGGLQRQSKGKSRSRLGPIPILGDILGSRSRSEERTELVFFLRPYVLTNTPADNASTFERINELPQRDAIRQYVDPQSTSPRLQPQPSPQPPGSVLDRILPK